MIRLLRSTEDGRIELILTAALLEDCRLQDSHIGRLSRLAFVQANLEANPTHLGEDVARVQPLTPRNLFPPDQSQLYTLGQHRRKVFSA